MDYRKNWTAQQTQLRALLSARAHFAEGIQLFLQQHAAVHTTEISGGQAWSLQDEVLAGLSEAQMRACPRPGLNSIVWLLWHTARIEDITLSFLVLEQPQVRLAPAWSDRLGISLMDVGAGMDAAEVASFSARISIPGLLAYRAAVGCSTRAGIPRLLPEQLKDVVPASAIDRLKLEGSISPKAAWLGEYYCGRPKSFFLTRITSHNYIHLNEAGRVPGLLKKKNNPPAIDYSGNSMDNLKGQTSFGNLD
jgi:hypothetical protein